MAGFVGMLLDSHLGGSRELSPASKKMSSQIAEKNSLVAERKIDTVHSLLKYEKERNVWQRSSKAPHPLLGSDYWSCFDAHYYRS
mmetsp:Transcript_5983/g.9188  ORF Transcript_5983/g.9188 Transcript_5983/m.9188 type:complete len:85 (+) Transcript_5983:100-354(+)